MKQLAAWTLVLFAGLPLQAADDSLKAAYAMASKDNACYGSEVLESICNAFHDSRDADHFVALIEKKLKISNASARVVALTAMPMIGDMFSSTEIQPEERAAYEDRLKTALRLEKNRAPLIAMLAMLVGYNDDAEERYRAMLPLIGNDTASAIAAAREARGPAAAKFLEAALANDPENAEVIAAIGDVYQSSVRSVFGPIRITADGAAVRIPSATVEQFAQQLAAIADEGMPHLLLTAFDAIPPQMQKQLLAPADSRDLALDLAAAALLEKNPALAAKYFQPYKGKEKDDEAAFRRLVAASMPDSHDDAFDVISPLIDSTAGGRGELLAMYAERNGYAGFAAEARREAKLWRGAPDESIPESWRETIASVIRHDDPPVDKPAARGTPSSLAQERIVPFTEHKIEEIQPKASIVKVIDCSDAQAVARTTHLPPYVSPLRMERNGEEVVAVVISSALDPIGEVGLGAYWVLRSSDGGNTWSRYYTGLRENMPYVVSRTSTLPLLDGGHLRIEVEVQELDMASITFPPVAMRIARSESGLYLDMPIADLARDSDSDGLTDLYEERITSDPFDADTDGDGIADGEDLLPRVARATGKHNDTAEILAAVLEGFRLGAGRLVVGIGSDTASAELAQQSCEVRTSDVGDPVLFLIGDPSQFAGLTLARRTIVLTDEEERAYVGKFGLTFPARIKHLIIDTSGKRAILELDQSWAGETFLLTKTEEGWEARIVSSWIT